METYDIEIKEDNQPVIPRRKLNPPIDYSSRAVRRRLFMLVASFFLILFLMREVRKPERWQWMGFDKNGRQIVTATEANPSAPTEAPSTSTTEADFVETPGITIRMNQESLESKNTPSIPSTPQAGELPQVAQTEQKQDRESLRGVRDFWKAVFLKLDNKQQQNLIALFYELVQGQSYDDATADKMRAMLDQLDSVAKAQSLSELEALQNTNSPLADQIVASTREWDQSFLPFLRGAIDKDMTTLELDKSAFGIWQSHIESAALTRIRDKSEVYRPDEGAAWLVNWTRVLKDSGGSYKPATSFDLSTQPEAYRGQAVEISGTVAGVERYLMVKNALGIDCYYILWIVERKPEFPMVCVYTLKLPEGIEPPKENYARADFDVKVKAHFHKLRNYVGSEEQIETCPMLFANQAQIVFRPVVESTWRIPFWFMPAIGVILLCSAVAALVSVYRASQHKVYPAVYSKSRLRLDESLDELKNDPSIKTVKEQIAELEKEDQ
jgi:hypothetical protein